jgi:hypothetical protein
VWGGGDGLRGERRAGARPQKWRRMEKVTMEGHREHHMEQGSRVGGEPGKVARAAGKEWGRRTLRPHVPLGLVMC